MAAKRASTSAGSKKKAPAAKLPVPRKGGGVSKTVKVAGKRIGGAQAANQARQQKRRDSR